MIGDLTHKFLFNIHYAIGDLKMVTAIVLMNADRMQIKDVAQKLVDMHQVTEVFSVAS